MCVCVCVTRCVCVCVCVLQVIISGAVSVGRCAVNTYCPGPAPRISDYTCHSGAGVSCLVTLRVHIFSGKKNTQHTKRVTVFSHISINSSRLNNVVFESGHDGRAIPTTPTGPIGSVSGDQLSECCSIPRPGALITEADLFVHRINSQS